MVAVNDWTGAVVLAGVGFASKGRITVTGTATDTRVLLLSNGWPESTGTDGYLHNASTNARSATLNSRRADGSGTLPLANVANRLTVPTELLDLLGPLRDAPTGRPMWDTAAEAPAGVTDVKRSRVQLENANHAFDFS
jgi:hypothetical protein